MKKISYKKKVMHENKKFCMNKKLWMKKKLCMTKKLCIKKKLFHYNYRFSSTIWGNGDNRPNSQLTLAFR